MFLNAVRFQADELNKLKNLCTRSIGEKMKVRCLCSFLIPEQCYVVFIYKIGMDFQRHKCQHPALAASRLASIADHFSSLYAKPALSCPTTLLPHHSPASTHPYLIIPFFCQTSISSTASYLLSIPCLPTLKLIHCEYQQRSS